jgi:hypothetical protein
MTMGFPRSWAKIKFPVSLIDEEIRGHLKREYEAEFNEDGTPEDLSVDTEVEDGIFSLEDGEARYGEFGDLEDLLISRGIPFDRESGMDWNSPPAIRIYRPGVPAFDHYDSTPDSYDEVVSVSKIRELLGRDDPVGAAAIRRYLDESFPAYPPLADFVKEA